MLTPADGVEIHVGDVRAVLPTLEAESVDCVATSPPFYSLRDYQAEGQIGLEDTPDEWAAALVEAFRECRRVLRPEGTLWVECGDSYNNRSVSRRSSHQGGLGFDSPDLQKSWVELKAEGRTRMSIEDGDLKEKDLIGAPWLLAFALRADGWWLRQAIIWHKPNCMPESARDRCTTNHSYIFLLAKQPRYWTDMDAIAEPAAWERWGDQTVPKYEGSATASGWMQPKSKDELVNGNGRQTKNARSVWTIPTGNFSGAHFATWPEKLAERILLAGCPRQVCATCGAAPTRMIEIEESAWRRRQAEGEPIRNGLAGDLSRMGRRSFSDPADRAAGGLGSPSVRSQSGWTDCGHGRYQPGVVLDPFAGAGTTAVVAKRLGRRAVMVELNAEYAEIAAERCRNWWKPSAAAAAADPDDPQLTLIG